MRRREQLESVPSPRHHGPQGRAETLEFVRRKQVQVVVRVLPADSSAERSHADLQPSPAALAVALGLWNDSDSCTCCVLVASVPSLTEACAHSHQQRRVSCKGTNMQQPCARGAGRTNYCTFIFTGWKEDGWRRNGRKIRPGT